MRLACSGRHSRVIRDCSVRYRMTNSPPPFAHKGDQRGKSISIITLELKINKLLAAELSY